MESSRYPTPNGSGWILDVARHVEPERVDRSLRPVLIIPGYCMNTFPLCFHPEGPSMIEYLTGQGLEVWTANLRGQGDSRSVGGKRNVGFAALALTDLPAVIRTLIEGTESQPDRFDAIGCSLGGTLLFTYLAHHPLTHRVGSLVGIGAPLRWDSAHPFLRLAFASSRLASVVNVRGTRRLARAALPLARRVPRLLSIYMNTSIIDMSQIDELVKTVEDPIPKLNSEIAKWMKEEDLVVRGVNVTSAVRGLDIPFLSILANADGIVPPAAARSAVQALGGNRKDILEVGNEEIWFAHADLFVSRYAQEWVFEPLARWLIARNREGPELNGRSD